MSSHVILLSVPGLRARDLDHMPNLRGLTASGGQASLTPTFPSVTCPVQANMTTGVRPRQHGVVANGFYWREKHEVEMWTAWNDCIQAPQIWDLLHQRHPGVTSAVWFPLHSKGCGADYICTPAPIHNPDGSESLWCYTKPTALYGELRDALGHFPLMHFWGPLANIKSTDWIARSAVQAAKAYRPNFFYIYLPHLDYAAQRTGPDSPPAMAALGELDTAVGQLVAGFAEAYGGGAGSGGVNGSVPLWLVASEYTISPVDHVTYPNRVLRQAGLLQVIDGPEGEQLDLIGSRAWALVDHQLSHVFVADGDRSIAQQVATLFRNRPGIAEVLTCDDLAHHQLDHPRSGEVVLVSTPNSWQAYYWWLDDQRAPKFARTVDIHRKPGYDPVELHFDPATRAIPLDATLVRGSHGAPVVDDAGRGIVLSSLPGVLKADGYGDIDIRDLVLRQFA